MAMTMTGEVQLPASREVVWAKLNDPAVLKSCIPGCEELNVAGENQFEAVAKMKVGPVSARFKGKVTLSDFDPPNSYKISGEGEGGVAGFAKGGATVALAEKDGARSSVIMSRPRSAESWRSSASGSSMAPPRSLPMNSSRNSPRP
jgi:carbon monoxide dehydrogenase subunit G